MMKNIKVIDIKKLFPKLILLGFILGIVAAFADRK